MTTEMTTRVWIARGGSVSGPYAPEQILQMEQTLTQVVHCQIRVEGQQGWLSYSAWKQRHAPQMQNPNLVTDSHRGS